MKKQLIFVVGGLVLGGGVVMQAHAATVAVCTGTAGPAAARLAKSSDGSTFLKNDMNFKCSNNVLASADQDAEKAWVAAASRKGKFYWGGNTNGGSATKLGTAEVTPGTDPSPSGQLNAAKIVGAST